MNRKIGEVCKWKSVGIYIHISVDQSVYMPVCCVSTREQTQQRVHRNEKENNYSSQLIILLKRNS